MVARRAQLGDAHRAGAAGTGTSAVLVPLLGVRGDDDRRRAVLEDGLHSGRRIGHRQWDEDGSAPQAGQGGDDEVDGVGQMEGDPIPFLYPVGAEPGRHLGRLVAQARE